jgi:hypothetical protein
VLVMRSIFRNNMLNAFERRDSLCYRFQSQGDEVGEQRRTTPALRCAPARYELKGNAENLECLAADVVLAGAIAAICSSRSLEKWVITVGSADA